MIFAFGPKGLPIFVCDARRCASLRRNLPARTLDAPSPSLPENGPEVYQAAAARGDDAARAARSRAFATACLAFLPCLAPSSLARGALQAAAARARETDVAIEHDPGMFEPYGRLSHPETQ